MDEITIPRIFDAHCHFRLDPMLWEVLSHTARYARYGLAMPNTSPRAILTAEDVVWYRDEILRVHEQLSMQDPIFAFEPVMTIAIRDTTTPAMVKQAFKAGAKAGKVYPWGVTTNSQDGLRDFDSQNILRVFKTMQDLGMLLLLHGELDRDRVLVMKREKIFLPTLVKLANNFPDLKIVFEHVSSKVAIKVIKELSDNVVATVTAHHLYLTQNDILGCGVKVHNACMPTPKDFLDRDALVAVAVSGNPKFFLGSDTAPHDRKKKESAESACGVFSAPVLLETLAQVFESKKKLKRLQDFTSTFGSAFYDLPISNETITLVKEEWKVPKIYGNVVPFKAGETLQWKLL